MDSGIRESWETKALLEGSRSPEVELWRQTLFTLDPLGSESRTLPSGSRVESDARALSVYGVLCLLYFPVYASFLVFLRLL